MQCSVYNKTENSHTSLFLSWFCGVFQFSQCLKGNVPLDVVLSQAIELLEQLKSDEYCPYDIKVNSKHWW